MKTDSTILDYTRSVEDIRKFKLKEECHKIAAEYERFNIENGVYEKFGEGLLEKAKDRYKAEFNNFHLTKIVTEMELECPESYKIKANIDDYDWCDQLREICPIEWRSWGEFRSCYSWYTIWRIAKTYNCKHGCVVSCSPDLFVGGTEIRFTLDWSQDASDCISKEKWRECAEDDLPNKLIFGCIGSCCWIVIWAIWAAIAAGCQSRFIGFLPLLIPVMPMFLLFSFSVRNIFVRMGMNKRSWQFESHCEKIEQTKVCYFNVKCGRKCSKHEVGWR